YGLDPAHGVIRQRAAIGRSANHFPTPSVGEGLLLAANARQVVAFPVTGHRVPPADTSPAAGSGSPGGPADGASPPGQSGSTVGPVLITVAAVVVVLALGGGLYLSRRRGYLAWRK
ncbi:MAG TPA: hypothetical protein VN597_07005, partial [Streptosporangiaceae bacterium]|nr:hypothetical protein [Streptosporangiaceae bacterium]